MLYLSIGDFNLWISAGGSFELLNSSSSNITFVWLYWVKVSNIFVEPIRIPPYLDFFFLKIFTSFTFYGIFC